MSKSMRRALSRLVLASALAASSLIGIAAAKATAEAPSAGTAAILEIEAREEA